MTMNIILDGLHEVFSDWEKHEYHMEKHDSGLTAYVQLKTTGIEIGIALGYGISIYREDLFESDLSAVVKRINRLEEMLKDAANHPRDYVKMQFNKIKKSHA